MRLTAIIFCFFFGLLLLCVIVIASIYTEQYPQVQISDGILNGAYLTTRNDRKISGFTGIPFAKPPVGDLRFQAPVPNDPWTEERNAVETPPECTQRNFLMPALMAGEEDCLYLNVYTPKLSNFETELLPVMFWIHGGGFIYGNGNEYNPHVLLDKDIVLVTSNYRLGPLGFLATGDDVVPGNNGLKDQNLALQWVKKNIRKFGGDPDRITLFGESAGAVSVNYHMLSPLSKGLFSKAILQSGTSLCCWALSEKETVENTHKLAKSLNCSIESSADMVECLRKIDAAKIIELDDIFKVWGEEPMMPFKPVIEPKSLKNSFLSDHPMNIISSGKSMDVPIIIGITSEEGGFKAPGFKKDNLLDEFDAKFDKILPVSLFYDRMENHQKITEKIKKFYFTGKSIKDSIKDIINLYTDSFFFKCSDDIARLHAKYYKQPVYFYLLGYKGNLSISILYGGGDEYYGTVHGDDLLYLFPMGEALFPDTPPTDRDRRISEIFATLWTNFAYTGNPTPNTSE
ncbi:unnamed protein product, partial [Phyllotreta striolata]